MIDITSVPTLGTDFAGRSDRVQLPAFDCSQAVLLSE